jgi:hypothetical protein
MCNLKSIFVLAILMATAVAQSAVFTVSGNFVVNAATSPGAGHAPTMGIGSVSMMSGTENLQIVELKSITFHGLQTSRASQFQIYLSGAESYMYLHRVTGGSAGVNGDITFQKVASTTFTSAVFNSSGTLMTGVYRPLDAVIQSGVPPRQNFDHFAGTPAGWSFLISNISTTSTVRFTGVTVEAEVRPVPEPATLVALGAGFAALLRRRRKA